MIKTNEKLIILALMVAFLFFHALTIYAYQTDFLSIIGNTNIAIGKPSVTYDISYNINGTIFDC